MRKLDEFEIGLLLGRLGLTASMVEDILDGTMKVRVVEESQWNELQNARDYKPVDEPLPQQPAVSENPTCKVKAVIDKTMTPDNIDKDLDDIFGTSETFEEPKNIIEPAPDKWVGTVDITKEEPTAPVVVEPVEPVITTVEEPVQPAPVVEQPTTQPTQPTTASNPWLSNKWETLK